MPILFLSLLLSILAGPAIAQQTDSSSAEAIRLAEQNLRQILAGPHERAFRQILTAVQILPDTLDTAAVYDLIVHFDPQRYQNPQVGAYPLTFEDQFIIWGKRISLYTRGTVWTSSRFFLRDLSTGHEEWIFTEDARTLYKPATAKLPPRADTAFPQWLKLIYAVEARTDLRTMSRWLRLMHAESRDQLDRRLQAAAGRSSLLPKE